MDQVQSRLPGSGSGNPPQSTVSVIICAYTERRLPYIYDAVRSVLDQTRPADEILLVIDHNPELFNRLKAELADKVRVVHHDEGERGAIPADNLGIDLAGGEIVAFMDDDACADRDWLDRLLRHYHDANVAACGGRLISTWDNGRPGWFAEELDWLVGGTYKGHPETRRPVKKLIMCNMSVRRDVFRTTGLFDTSFGRRKDWGTGTESEFFLRMKQQLPDATVIYDPEAIVYHRVPDRRANLRYLVLRSYNEGFHKALIRHAFAAPAREVLATENAYLRYAMNSMTGKLARFYRRGNLGQAAAMMTSVAATGAGYLAGMARR